MRDELSGPAREARQEVAAIGREARQAERSSAGFGRTLSRLGRTAGGLGTTLRRLAVRGIQAVTIAAAAAGAGLLLMGRNAIQAATDADETQAKFDTVFGRLRGQMQRTVDYLHERFGIATADLQDAASMFGVFGKAAGISGDPLASFSANLTQAGLDLSSFYNVAADGADGTFAAIRSGLSGETEPLRRFGIFINETAVKAKAASMGLTGTLTDQQKVAVRYRLILDQLGDAAGDLERTQDSAANQTRKLSGYWADFQVTLGRLALPAVTGIVRALNDRLGPVTVRLARHQEGLTQAFRAGNWPRFARLVDRVAGAHGRLAPVVLAVVRWVRVLARVVVGTIVPGLLTFGRILVAVVTPAVELVGRGLRLLTRHGAGARVVVVGLAAVLAGVAVFTSPVLGTVAALVLLVAGVRAAWRRFSAFRDVVRGVARFLGDLGGHLRDLWQSLDFSGAASALEGLRGAVGDLGDALGGWDRVLPVVAGVAAALALLAGGPVTALAGLAAGLLYLYNRFEPVRRVADAVARFYVGTLVPAFLTLDRIIVQGLVAAIRLGVRWVRAIIDVWRGWWRVTSPVRSVLAAVGRALARIAGVSLDGLIGAVRAVWRWTEPLRGLVGALARLWVRVGAIGLAVLIGAVRTVISLARRAWDNTAGIRGVLAIVGRMGLGVLKTALGVVADLLAAAWDAARPVRDALHAVGQLGLGVLQGALSAVRTTIDGIRDGVEWLLEKLPTVTLPDWVPGGDTATPRGRGGRGPAAAAESYRHVGYAAGITGGRHRVTSAYRPRGGSGDHARGAVDLVGSKLPTLAHNVRRLGGFAELHGQGRGRHLHVAPMGDTATPRRGRGGHRGAVILEAGAVQVAVYNPASGVDVKKAVKKGITEALRDAEERD